MKLCRLCALPFGLVLMLIAMSATAATFQTDTYIAATNLLYEGEPLEVTNCTLTIDGPHTFASLTVQSGGIVTHSPWTDTDPTTGCLVTVTGRVEVLFGGRFDVTGRGYSQGTGVGASSAGIGAGGGHGGYGGLSASNAPGGLAHGAITNPVTLGGPGGPSYYGPGGSGGGRVQLIAGDSILIEGVITAMGEHATNSRSGGGAGGSIWLEAPIITGTGTITCNGGAGEPWLAGGGGGGRIGLFCRTNTFTGSIDQFGGFGHQWGGAGTLYIKSDQFTNGLAIIRNNLPGGATGARNAENADMIVSGMAVLFPTEPLTLNNLIVQSNSWIMLTNTTTVSAPLTIANDFIIESTAGIVSRYYSSFQGNGAPFTSAQPHFGGGAGHAGYGGHGKAPSSTNPTIPETGGMSYNLVTTPNQPGSRGGFNGGFGGGVVRITAGGSVVVNGTIDCRGDSPVSEGPGGGSGGSVWITASSISGTGTISADGGSALGSLGGGGSGGRIALYATNDEASVFSGRISATGGTGVYPGAAGTILLGTSSIPSLLVDNGGIRTTNTSLAGLLSCDLSVQGGAIASLPYTSGTLRHLAIGSNSILFTAPSYPSTLTCAAAQIQTGGVFRAAGSQSSYGPTMGRYYAYGSTGSGGGGGHIGAGGDGARLSASYPGAVGGAPYDSNYTPGGPGGTPNSQTSPFPYGGGSLNLTVTGPLCVDGELSADGFPGMTLGCGGGAGGSLKINAGILEGTGNINASGGSGHPPYGGGGGGGRIFISSTTNHFTGVYSAKGGPGYVAGGAGSVQVKSSFPNYAYSRMTLDNGGVKGTNSIIVWDYSAYSSYSDLSILGGASATSTGGQVNNLTIGNLSRLYPNTTSGQVFDVNVRSNLTIQAGGTLDVTGAGSSYSTPPAGFLGAGGANFGFGGRGSSLNSRGGAPLTIVRFENPATPGGSGAWDTYSGSPTPYGGGAMKVTVGKRLHIDGSLLADGLSAIGGSGGGAGGSVAITTETISGSGLIAARGGDATLPGGGGGGGGIALAFFTNLFTGTTSARGGQGFQPGGAGTVYWSPMRSQTLSPALIVDNGGLRGTNTAVPISTSTLRTDITIRGGAKVVPYTGASLWEWRDISIEPDSELIIDTHSVKASRHLRINAGAVLQSDGFGASGPGAGYAIYNQFMGGSYAGTGGLRPSFFTYGSLVQPVDYGSKGADSISPGGKGGGIARVFASVSLTNHGRISANGQPGIGGSGGGSGGSILLTTPILAGTGSITANGGAGSPSTGGGGGGGRISLKYSNNYLTGPIQAAGGTGVQAGGAGTIYATNELTGASTVIVNNAGQSGAGTMLNAVPMLNLIVSSGAKLQPVNSVLFNSISIEPYGVITAPFSFSYLNLATLHDFTVAPAGLLQVDYLGYYGPGDGFCPATGQPGSGAGHGGVGGDAPGAPGGAAYGSEQWPVTPGSSGGGIGSDQARGGGALRLTVGGTLSVNGWISADGGEGKIDNSGGGSGGSILISAKTLNGTGTIKADGGTGELFLGGGGGGGRLAIYSPANDFTGRLSVRGGDGFMPGSTGTVYTTDTSIPMTVIAQSPTGDVFTGISAINLEFSLPPDPATVQASDFQISTPGGVLPPTDVSVAAVNSTTWQLLIPTQTMPGAYQVQAGPEIQHLLGTAMSQTYTGAFTIVLPVITGTVKTTNNTPVPDVLIHAEEQIPPASTDATGSYTLGAPTNLSFTITPSKEGWLFVPSSRSYTNLETNLSGQDFVAVTEIAPQLTQSVSGTNLLLGWTGMSDVQYTVMASTNLANWSPYSQPVWGSNQWLEIHVPVNPEKPIQFLRLQATY